MAPAKQLEGIDEVEAMGRLDGKIAIITGGARGQGAEEGKLFAEEGAKVILTDILAEDGRATAASIGGEFYSHDVGDEGAWERIVEAVMRSHGKIDVLVNNAGVFLGKRLVDTDLQAYEQLMRINATGVFLGMRAVARPMRDAQSGSIINISSVAGLVSATNAFAYGASKWAVRGMTKTAAVELGRAGVRVNSIHPGMIQTDMLDELIGDSDQRRDRMTRMVPLGKTAEPVDIANMALFLASDESRYATGSEFVVDGGWVAM